jgi:AraC-like DNA-binding protein
MTAGAIGLSRFEMSRGQRFDAHQHTEHQLVWASRGVLMAEVEDRYWILPTTFALWIPGGVEHAVVARRESVMHGIYLDPARRAVAWRSPTIVSVVPLARHLIGYLTTELDDALRSHAETVLLDVLRPVVKATIELPLPSDDRARQVTRFLLADPTDQRGPDALGPHVGASSRTLQRLFLDETGMTFTQWRTHARLQAAIGLLAEGEPVARVAGRVGYATASAFVAAFRRVTGHTPAAYFGTRPQL